MLRKQHKKYIVLNKETKKGRKDYIFRKKKKYNENSIIVVLFHKNKVKNSKQQE